MPSAWSPRWRAAPTAAVAAAPALVNVTLADASLFVSPGRRELRSGERERVAVGLRLAARRDGHAFALTVRPTLAS